MLLSLSSSEILHNSDALGQPELGNVSLLWVYLQELKSREAKNY